MTDYVLPAKTCSKCKQLKLLSEFGKSKGRLFGNSRCKSCIREISAAIYRADPKKHLEYTKRWRLANPEKALVYRKKWMSNNREAYLESQRDYARASNAALSDRYVKNGLRKQGLIDPTPELIELKRQYLNLTRTLKCIATSKT